MAKHNLQFKLPVSIFKEGKTYVAYSPALELSSCGKNVEHAKKMFAEAADLFFDYLVEHNTLEDVLLDLGWQKKNKSFVPPLEVFHGIQSVSVPLP